MGASRRHLAALISGAILMNDDDDGGRQSASATTQPAGPSLRLGGPGLDIQALLQRAEPSVVTINALSVAGGGTGTGFVISEEGYIVTNHHVVAGGETFEVVFADGKRYDATLVGSFRQRGAMVRIDRTHRSSRRCSGRPDLQSRRRRGHRTRELGPGARHARLLGQTDPRRSESGILPRRLIQTDAAIKGTRAGRGSTRTAVVGINTAIIPT